MWPVSVSLFNLTLAQQSSETLVGAVSSLSGGELFFHPRFDVARDGPAQDSQLRRIVSRTTGYSCVMRVRCSTGQSFLLPCSLALIENLPGLRVSRQYGNFYENAAGDMQFGTLDADKSIAALLEHSNTLSDRGYAFIQSAVLYTTITGQRRVRVCNVAVQVATLAGNVFRFADMDTVVAYTLREGESSIRCLN